MRSGDELSLGERAADRMRNGMGSWPFVFGFFGVLIAWALLNSLVLRNQGWDPYPYILLNLFLSMMAGVQAAALLIAAKRSDSIASEIALHTEVTADEIKGLLERNTALTQAIHEISVQQTEILHRLDQGPGAGRSEQRFLTNTTGVSSPDGPDC